MVNPITQAWGTVRGWFSGSQARDTQGTTHRLEMARRMQLDTTAAGLTPEQVTSAISQAREGDPRQMMALLEDVESRDSHIAGVLGVRRRALITLSWHLEPADPENLVDRVHAKAVELLIRRCSNLRAGLYDLTAAICQGYHPAEIQWSRDADGLVYPAELAYRPARWLLPHRDDPSVLHLADQADLIEGVPLWPHKWVVHRARSRSSWPAMSGLGPTLLWLYLFKRYALTDWVAYSEKYGTPFRLGKYPQGAVKSDIDQLVVALESLGVDAWGAVPNTFDLQLVTDGGSRTGADVFQRLIEYLDHQVSKLVLGQTLTTEAGATGTQALGTVHNEVRRDIRDGDAEELADTLTRDLVTPVYLANFGRSAPPRWVFEVAPPTDRAAEAAVQEARGRVFAAAKELGVELAVVQVRESLDLRAPEADEETIRPAVAIAPVVSAPTPSVAAAGPDGAAAEQPASSTALNGAQVQSALQIVQAVATGQLPRASGVAALMEFFNLSTEAAERIMGEVGRGFVPPTPADPAAPPAAGFSGRLLWGPHTAFADAEPAEAARVDALIQVSAEDQRRLWREVMDTLRRELGDVTTVEQVRARLPAAIRAVDLRSAVRRLAETQLRAETLGRIGMRPEGDRPALLGTSPIDDVEGWSAMLGLSPEVWSARVAEVERLAEQTLEYALLRAAQDVLAQLEDEGDLTTSASVDAAVEAQATAPQRTDAVVQAAAGDAHGRGRFEAVAGARGLFLRYHTQGDDRVRPAHRAMEGFLAASTDPVWKTWRPPNGYGCRCWLTVHTAEEVTAAGWRVSGALPTVNGAPARPDGGWGVDLHSYDWSTFPPEWKAELEAAKAARRSP